MSSSKKVLSVIVFSQFCCTSLWFAGNAIMADLASNFNLPPEALGHLTSAVQFGFIAGTLLFAIFAIADRYAPSKVFFSCAIAGAIFNLGMLLPANSLLSLSTFRFLTGFFLAGIYPVGMKIAADYYREGLGKSLGLLVGALVLGTAFPHLLSGLGSSLPWREVIIMTTLIALVGGILIMWLVPDGPYRKTSNKLQLSGLIDIFKNRPFRQAAFGYFGHMWELYAFWTFVPVMLAGYMTTHVNSNISIPLTSFLIIGFGGPACVVGGFIAHLHGNRLTALAALLLSGLCCLLSPLLFTTDSIWLFVLFLIFWGWVVVADSPLFSTLVAEYSTPQLRGSALTIVNCIGFSITIISIQLINIFQNTLPAQYLYLLLAIGPAFGLLAQTNLRIAKSSPR